MRPSGGTRRAIAVASATLMAVSAIAIGIRLPNDEHPQSGRVAVDGPDVIRPLDERADTRTARSPTDGPGPAARPIPTAAPLFGETINVIQPPSAPDFPETVREVTWVTAHDGVRLYLEVVRPDPTIYGDGPWPVILEASPYHGSIYDRRGTRILPDPRGPDGQRLGLTGYFPPRGYAVVMMDLRGTGRSQGCLDHLGPNDAADIARVVTWSAEAPWSNGRVGLTGHSYPGSTPMLAAATMPNGLATIVPSAGIASMYDHQFQLGVPYALQWAGPMVAYEELALCRHLLVCGGDNFGNDMEYIGCGIPQSSIFAGHGQINGQYQAWHAARDHRAATTTADIPMFLIHGVNDDAARIPGALWFFDRQHHPEDRLWIGQWDHGVADFHPNGRGDEWTDALHRWFDRHLMLRPVQLRDGVEAFLNDGMIYRGRFDDPKDEPIELWPDFTVGSVAGSPGEPNPRTVALPLAGTSQAITLQTDPYDEDVVLFGVPRMRLVASVSTSQVIHLVAQVHSVRPDGERAHVTTCSIQPQLRDGVDRTTPIVPNDIMDLEPVCFPVAHRVTPGMRLELRIGTTSPHHVAFPTVEPMLTIYAGPEGTMLSLPRVMDPALHEDPLLEP